MPNQKRPDAIIFDWDNTLIDSWQTIHAALVVTFTEMGRQPWTFEETKSRVRQSLRDSFPDLFGERWEEAATIFYDAFERLHIEKLQPMPKAKTMLENLSKCIPTLGVVSNKTGKYLRKEVAHLGWDRFFVDVIGAGDASRDKPNSAPIDLFRENNALKGSSLIWYVGDADIDIKTANNSGCLSVLLHTNEQNMAQFDDIFPEIILSDCEDLAALVQTL